MEQEQADRGDLALLQPAHILYLSLTLFSMNSFGLTGVSLSGPTDQGNADGLHG